MKRMFFSLSLALLMMFSLVLSASADLIWEPFDDSFYTEHHQECTYIGRSYQLAGYDGTVTVFTAYTVIDENGCDVTEQFLKEHRAEYRWGKYNAISDAVIDNHLVISWPGE